MQNIDLSIDIKRYVDYNNDRSIPTLYHTMKGVASTMYRINKGKLSVAMLNAGVDTSKRLAEVSGVSVNTISRLHNGGSVKLHTLQRLAKTLGVDPAELIEEVR